MKDFEMRKRSFKRERLHKPATGSRSIARIYIDMLAPEALRAVIGISITSHLCATMFAHKIFHAFLELFCLHTPNCTADS